MVFLTLINTSLIYIYYTPILVPKDISELFNFILKGEYLHAGYYI